MCGGWATHLAVLARVIDSLSGSVHNRHSNEFYFRPLGELIRKVFIPVTLLDRVYPHEGMGDEFF